MVNKKTVVLINSCDRGGGAGNIVWSLFSNFKQKSFFNTWIVTAVKNSDDSRVLLIPNNIAYNSWEKIWFFASKQVSKCIGRIKGFGKLKNFLNKIARPNIIFNEMVGREVFNHPGTAHIFDLIPSKPDIIHCHNLHYKYFDLRELPNICKKAPVVITLHDSWLLGGHCAHSFDCKKWMTGCGACPYLKTSPPIRLDSSAYNLQRKRNIYAKCSLNIVTPCKWLMDKVQKSVLAGSMARYKIIPNGVDTSIFKPADKLEIRKQLSIPEDKKILLFVGQGITDNSWKDYDTLKKAFTCLSTKFAEDLLLICLGENRPSDFINRSEIRFIPYQRDFYQVAKFYQIADIYVHASKIDTFPNSVLEALSCGVTVIASEVGGIVEQIKNFKYDKFVGDFDLSEATGFLVKPKDVDALTQAIDFLFDQDLVRSKLSQNARNDVLERFSLDKMILEYLNFYEEILNERGS